MHYYLVGRLTMPRSVLEEMLGIANDEDLTARVIQQGLERDRTWANQYAQSAYRDQLISRLTLPTREDLERDDELRRKAAAIVSYVMAEGSIRMQAKEWGEHAVNITFAAHETDLYEHFRLLVRDVFSYEMGSPQPPGNDAAAIRGFIYSRFIAEWLFENGVLVGEKAKTAYHMPDWVLSSSDTRTLISALQPWCDGEGSVNTMLKEEPTFALVQSTHADLDFGTVPLRMAAGRSTATIGRGVIRSIHLFGISLEDCCKALFKSEILQDVDLIAHKIGLRPKTCLADMNLKQDGFWSCRWLTSFDALDTLKMVKIGVIRQQRKVKAVARSS